MNKLKNLNFNNIVREDLQDLLGYNKISFKVIDDSNETIAEVNGREISLKDFASNYLYNEILKPELHYIFDSLLSENDKDLVNFKKMSIDDYVTFLNNKYEEDYEELETLNGLYKAYTNLVTLLNNVNDSDTYCFALDTIFTEYQGTGAGTLLIDYLKLNYNLIYLYSIMDIEYYFKDKVDFKEIINGFMYWTNEEKIKEIL